MIVLALNSGSSSLKYGLFRVDASRADALSEGEAPSADRVADLLADANAPAPDAIAHRIVHGGPRLRRHCLIDARVMAELESAAAFAPLHAPPALAGIGFARERFPDAVHVACIDTAFHAGLPDVARVLPIPKELRAEGVERYGFHGLSCESVVHQLAGALPGRLVIAHLGNGASVTAVRDGRSVDTSMGLTPSGGVVMGTRSGDLDPGVLIYLAREKKLDAAALEELVDRRSGLLGISGVASDMRRLHEAAPANADARLAVEMFCYSVRKHIAAMIAALGGIDLLVFTGGIGENDAAVRDAVCAGLGWFGVGIVGGSRCPVRVLPSRESERMARAAFWLNGR